MEWRYRAVSRKGLGVDIIWYVLLIGITVVVLFPVYLLFVVGFGATHQVFRQLPPILPGAFSLVNWQTATENIGTIINPLALSLETAFMVALISLGVSIPASYSISKLPTAPRYAFILFLFVTQMLPEIQLAIPISALVIRLGLYETALGLALAQSSIAIPMVAYILVGTFRTVPPNLSQSAKIDGASKLQAFYFMDLRLALTGIAVAFILAWLFSWDEFVFAQILLPGTSTIPPLIYRYLSRGVGTNAGPIGVADIFSIILITPVILVTFFLQKYLRSDVLAGALK